MNDFAFSQVNAARLSKPNHYRITGSIRDEDNLPLPGCIVRAFDRDPDILLHPDHWLGQDTTDTSGRFNITFDETAFADWFEGSPEVYLIVSRNGGVLVKSGERENPTGRMDFQIKLGRIEADPEEPDIYRENLSRMLSAFRMLFDLEGLASSDVQTVVEVLSRAVSSWVVYRDELARLAGYDAIQVPSRPRWTAHYHITRWDRPILPIEGDEE